MARTIDALHKNLPLGQNHILHDGEYADATARIAEAAFTDDNVDKVYKQVDDLSLWRCISQTTGTPAWERLGSGGGLVNFIESATTYDSVNSFNLTSTGDTFSGVTLGIQAGPLTLSIPDGADGGNKRGARAIDLQAYRNSPSEVASGELAVILGGGFNTASGVNSISYGYSANDFGINAKVSHGARLAGTGTGRAQVGRLILTAIRFNATPVVLLSDNNVGTAANSQLLLQDNQAMTFVGTCIAKKSGTADIASWKVEGCIVRETGAASTTLVASTVTAISNVPSWTLALSADTTNGGLSITFTGVAATTIHIVCNLESSEIILA